MNIDTSNFTYKWIKYDSHPLRQSIPKTYWGFKLDIQYLDENNKKVFEKRCFDSKEDKEYFNSKKDLYFYQPHISKEYLSQLRNERSNIAEDLSNYAILLNRLREVYQKAQKKENFIFDNKPTHISHYDYYVDFDAPLGPAIIKFNLKSYSSLYRVDEMMSIRSISDLEKALRIVKRRIPILNKKYDEINYQLTRVSNFPIFKNNSEVLKDKILSIINSKNGNVDQADAIYDFIVSDEFKSEYLNN